ncbi:Receptor-like protein 34 [Glycine soja]|uniref:Receptor-like protein 34 n=1 Tax=Glycine soja TaxID=3848 RepID=A0A445L7Y7_GLYSO|nr:Receptor-like protein 34 [Glycine soja]
MPKTLDALDLSGNFLNGHFDLSSNNISGHFPTFVLQLSKLLLTIGSVQLNKLFEDLRNLNTLNLSYNNLSVNVNEHLQNITNLSVLDLHQNKLQGPIYFTTWKRNVTHNEDEAGSKFIMKICYFPTDFYYQDSLIVTSIGLQMELVKVLTIFTSIDFSSNHFEGPIPKDLMNFKTICVLNSSNNALSGEISSSIVNLKELESLDLSQNSLSGEITMQLASLSFLSYLNLSFNHLVGKIPTGNDRLYSIDWKKNDGKELRVMPQQECARLTCTIDWNLITVELGMIFGHGIVFAHYS